MDREMEVRRLVIKTFHINKVKFSSKTSIEGDVLYLRENIADSVLDVDNANEYIKSIKLSIIEPENHDIFINSIMDFSPIATKVLGRLGEGITHALTGVYVMLTGVDEEGIQVAEFGSSEGILKEQVFFGRAGTPSKEDIILHVDVVLKKGMGTVRTAITAAHKVCDRIIQEIREFMKKMNGRLCSERYEYVDSYKCNRKKIVIVKQVAGQGAMYDTSLLSKEPGGVDGGRSIIDLGNVPIVLSPNEYRDGALRAMH